MKKSPIGSKILSICGIFFTGTLPQIAAIILISTLVAGCSSVTHVTPTRAYTVQSAFSWESPGLIDTVTIHAHQGEYFVHATDNDGLYISTADGMLSLADGKGRPSKAPGGIFIPNDRNQQVRAFIYPQGGNTAVNGIVMFIPPSNKPTKIYKPGPAAASLEITKIQ